MPLLVSKEASGPQKCRNKRKLAVDKDLKAKKLKILSFLCIIEVTGAMWILSLAG